MIKLHWDTIKSSLHNPIIKISYVVVIGLPILLELMHAANVQNHLSTSFYEVFYSSILLIITFLLYAVAAPSEIKKYLDIHEYVDKNKGNLASTRFERIESIVLPHLDEQQVETRKKIIDLHKKITEETDLLKKQELKSALNELVAPEYESCVVRFLQKEWHLADTKKNLFILFLCYLFLLGAIILSLLVFIHRIYIVVQNNVTP